MTEQLVFPGGLQTGGRGIGRHIGPVFRVDFDNVASVGAGAALTTIQAWLAIERPHRVRAVGYMASAVVAVAGATDPAVAIYQHLPIPSAPTVAMISPAAAGNIEDGVHKYAVTFVSAAGETTPSPTASITIADKTVNGKTVVTIPLGPTGTTQRKIYRTLTGAEVLTLLTTVANNTATTYTDNVADATLSGALPIINTAAFTIQSATTKLSEAARNLVHQPVAGAMVDSAAPLQRPACLYSLRALTGASTGAITNLKAWMDIEYLT